MFDLARLFIILMLSYLLGSIPSGLIIVRILSGKDVRQVASGRTGGTNAMRAAGIAAGLLTVIFDGLKGLATAGVVAWLMPGNAWAQVFAALAAILGHNYSIFLMERSENGKVVLRGGAGGATAVGGAIALWPLSGVIIVPLAALVFLFIGYASVTTISVTVFATIIFAVRAAQGLSSPVYIAYGVLSFLIVMWALRPNLERLRQGNERLHGLRAKYQKKKLEEVVNKPDENA
jgi:glycerol-3-phosphate acyltransferase PlsY